MNFIVIVSDTFRFDNLGCYESIRPRFRAPARPVMTPCLDRLAACSTVFDNAYIGSFPTVPHRKDLFTGRTVFPFEGWSPLAGDARTFIRSLGQAGYETMMVQDTPHTLRRGFNFDRDFDGYEFIRGQETDQLASWRADQPIDPALIRGEQNWRQHLANIAENRRREQDCYCAQTFTRAAEWLEGKYLRDRARPFLLYCDTFDPHEPWDAPRWYEDLYNPGYDGVCHRYAAQGRSDAFTPAENAHIRAMYAAEVTLVDRWIGHLLETVERMGLMDDTCVLFTADHGYCLGEHGWQGKNACPLYEEVAHVPLIVHLPGQARARRAAALAQPCDIAPTLLDLAGVARPETFEGLSLRPALEGRGRAAGRRFAFSRRCMNNSPGDARLAITGGGWSLLFDPVIQKRRPRALPWEMYHLATDPLQKRDVLKANLPLARKMLDAYLAWVASVNPPEGFNLPPAL